MWYTICVNKKQPQRNHSAKQGRLPVFFADMLNICDPVLAFDELMEEIDVKRYLPERPYGKKGRPGYNRVNMLKTVLFGFMEHGYAALRTLDDDCKVNLRYMYLMDWETPSYGAFGYFIREELQGSIEEIFQAVNARIFEKEHVDLKHVYIDGTKLEANANKYSWVWRKGTEKSRYRLFGKITALLEQINETLAPAGMRMEPNTEYAPEYLDMLSERYREIRHIDCEDCRGCPYAERCKKGEGNRTVRLNQELTQIHEEVLENLNCIHGALLRRNRSIQAEGTFGIMKQDRNYRRTRRRSLDFVRTELYLVSIGHNLYKYCNKLQKQQIAA